MSTLLLNMKTLVAQMAAHYESRNLDLKKLTFRFSLLGGYCRGIYKLGLLALCAFIELGIYKDTKKFFDHLGLKLVS